jgi:hypothetical protein
MKLVILESPYAATQWRTVEQNLEYARLAVSYCLLLNEAPLASHLLYTQPGILDDNVPSQRALGIKAGLSWYSVAEACVVFTDYGITPGMQTGINHAVAKGLPVIYRSIAKVQSVLNDEDMD